MDKTNDWPWIVRMGETINRLDVLQALLRAPLQVTGVRSQVFPENWRTEDEVIVTHRFILIQEGRMDYTVEGGCRRLEAGVQFFVPAWCRRKWELPRRAGSCRLLWCEFSSGSVTVPPVLCLRQPAEMRREEEAFRAMQELAGAKDERAGALQLEGFLKGCLARFWVEARATEAGAQGQPPVHPEVARAMTWLEKHYAEPEALAVFYRTLELSPNHFRLLFRRQTGETVQAVLARLRMRRARYLVRETTMPMKRIAAETGFADPLYFSSQYRAFWGRPATADRSGSGAA